MKSLVKKLGLAALVTLSSAGLVGGVSNAFYGVKNVEDIRNESCEERRKRFNYLSMGLLSVIPLSVGLGIGTRNITNKYLNNKNYRNKYKI